MKQRPQIRLILALSASLGAAAFGCNQEAPAVNRVQPNALAKEFFIGKDFQGTADDPEFYTQGTLIDVGYGAAQDGLFTSTYAQPVSRIKWQVTETMLFGRLAYERIEGSDGRGTGGPTQDGVIAVAYPIDSHFDIRRAYNTTTGETQNVVEENTSDRPWYERQYMRVDWSQNLNTDSYDYDTLSMVGIFGGVEYESLAYDITDPSDPDAPVFNVEDGYFDVTNKAFAKPGVIDLSTLGWGAGSFPACFLDGDFSGGTAPSGTCNPVELTIRQSFRKVTDSDYEPRDWDGFRFQAFGAFYQDRYGFARNYGMSDALWRRFINQPQIWERSHYYTNPADMTGAVECFTPSTTPFGADAHRDENEDGTEDECAAAGRGSKCDTFKQRCTLPFANRTPRTIAWYLSEKSDQSYFDSTAEAVAQWDVALRAAVRSAQYAECRNNTGGGEFPNTEEACLARFPIWFGQMDDNQDALELAAEVSHCRATNQGNCDALADSIARARGISSAIVSVAKMQPMITLCHSPVEAGDHEACGEQRLPAGITAQQCAEQYQSSAPDADLLATCRAALNVRRGDLRYNQVNVIPEPQTPSPWGIMVDSIDPLTGETLATSINVWAYVNDNFSQGLIDKLRYLSGELETADVTNGTNVRDWANAATAASNGGALPMLDKDRVKTLLGDFAGGETPADVRAVPTNVRADIRAVKRDLQDTRASIDAPSSTAAIYEARREHARGTHFEAELMTPMVQELNGIKGMPLTDGVMDMTSPLRGGNQALQHRLKNLREEALGRRGACIMERESADAPFSMVGLSGVLQEKFGAFNPADPADVQQARAERMRQYVGQRAHFSVIAHEMGHSIGLRHNFVSSSDAWQYRPQYWQLRTGNGAVTRECTDLSADGENCVGPRYFDPVTDEERDNLIWMWMQSSVMDYAGEVSQDMIGLGIYDFAATRMFYGDTVAVAKEIDGNSNDGQLLVDLQDNFGGILGFSYTLGEDDIHYSQLDKNLDLITDCAPVSDPNIYKPASWDEEANGEWSPLLDGQMVNVGGAWTRCRQQKVDYVPWRALESSPGSSLDKEDRPRMPYGFATDRWADLGNLAVYRHDNGADAYEIFNFMITSQEVWQVFDTYRRGRQDFSVKRSAGRTLQRYNEKLRDGAKGLGLMKNIYRNYALEIGYDFDSFWPIAATFFSENILASGLVFDHFTRTLARPESGDHFVDQQNPELLRSSLDTTARAPATAVTIPNGASGYDGTLGIGGQLVENRLCTNCGEYDAEYTLNQGSYYDKMYTAMLMTESVDNFISSSRTDFVDARSRAVSLADLFSEGYRRWLGNNLTGDDFLKGSRVAADMAGRPLRDSDGFPSQPIGWTSWWSDTPEVCFPGSGTTLCASYGTENNGVFDPLAPANTMVVDPQVGWEQQKFLIAWTMLYLFENEETRWFDMMRLWEVGRDTDPELDRRIELHAANGQVYIAQTFGTEEIFGKTVQRGIAARVLEYANALTDAAYVTTDGPDLDGNGDPDWFEPTYSATTGLPVVQWDPSVSIIDDAGLVQRNGVPGCNATSNENCTCTSNRACVELQHYLSVPAYLREAISAYGLGAPDARGVGR